MSFVPEASAAGRSMERRRPARWMFGQNESGATAVMAALTAPLLLAFAAIGAEGGYAYYKRAKLQTVADVAALSAATAIVAKGDPILEGKAVAASLGYHADFAPTVTVGVQSPPPSGVTHAGNADATVVEVTFVQEAMLARIILPSYTISARAISIAKKTNVGAGGCIMALEPNTSGAISIAGTARVHVPGCNVYSKSTWPDSMKAVGAGSLVGNEVHSAGGISGAGITGNVLKANAVIPEDPYASLPTPPMSAGERCDYGEINASGAITLEPGYYCGSINISGNKTFVTMNPGVYVIVGGIFKVTNSATVTGAGVTIITEPRATSRGWIGANFDIGSQSFVTLSAPTTGAYAGVALFSDRRQFTVAGWYEAHRILGGANTSITGAVYLPGGNLSYTGGGSATGCTQVIAHTIEFAGNSNLDVGGCEGTGVRFLGPQVASIALSE